MAVNAQDVFEVDQQARDYSLHEIPSVARVMAHPAVAAVVVMFDRDARVIGLQRNDERETIRQFIAAIEPGEGGSAEWTGDTADFATIDTSVLRLAIETATGGPRPMGGGSDLLVICPGFRE